MRLRRLIFSLIAATLAAALIACSSSSKSSGGGGTGPSGTQMSITLSVLPSSITEGASTNVYAVVNNDSTNQGVNWSVNCGGSSCGTLSNSTPNYALYTAPPDVISGPVNLVATSVADSSVNAAATFSISAATTLSNGTYVYSLNGQDGNGSYHIAGVFVLNNRMIQGGEQDLVDPSTSITADHMAPINSICPGPTCVGVEQIANTAADIEVNINTVFPLTETFRATIVNGVHALITEYDGATASGTIDMQTSTAAPAGSYAFVLSGLDESSGVPAAAGGVLNFDTSTGLDGSGSVLDVNDGFTVTPDVLLTSGTVSTPDTYGRVSITLTPSTPNFGSLALAGYVVDGNRIRLVEDPSSTDSNGNPNDLFWNAGTGAGATGGTAYNQGSNTGTFGASSPSVSGATYVFGTNGEDTVGSYQVAGLVTLNSDLSATGTLNFNDLSGSGPQAAIPFTGTYAVDSTGRVTLSNLTDNATFDFFLQMYLDGNGNATVVSLDSGAQPLEPTDEVAGLAAEQTGGGSFTASSFSGSYAFDATGWSGSPGSETEVDEIGIIAADGTSALSGAVDQNAPFSVGQIPKVAVSGTFTAAAGGVFTDGLTGLDIALGPTQTDVFTYYVIDPTRVVAIETDQNQLTLGYFDLKQ
jgi:hypothetical protein